MLDSFIVGDSSSGIFHSISNMDRSTAKARGFSQSWLTAHTLSLPILETTIITPSIIQIDGHKIAVIVASNFL